jgi:hypothetical protein
MPTTYEIETSDGIYEIDVEEEEKKKSAVGEFMGGAWEGLTSLPRTIGAALTDPVGTGKALIEGHKTKAQEVLDAMERNKQLSARVIAPNQTMEDRLRSFGGALKAGREGVLSAAGALVPAFGPGTADVVKGVENLEPRAMGEAAGSLATGPLLKGMGKLLPKVTTPGKGIRLSPLQAGETGAKAQLEAGLRQFVGSAGKFKDFDAAQVPQIAAMADDLVKSVSNFKGTPEQFGRLWKDGMTDGRAAAKSLVDLAYDGMLRPKVDAAGRSGFVETKLAKATAKKILKEMNTTGLGEAGLVTPLKRLVKMPDNVAFEVMKDYRSGIMDRIRNMSETKQISKTKAGVYEKQIAGALDTSMKRAATKGGFAKEWDTASGLHKNLRQTWDSVAMRRLAKQKPSQVAKVLEAMPVEDLKLAKVLMPPEAIKAAGANMLEKWLVSASEGRGAEAGLKGSSAPSKLSAKRLEAKVATEGLDRLEILLSKPQMSELGKLIEMVKRTQTTSEAAITGRRIGSAMNTSLVLGSQYGIVTMNPAILAGQGGMVLGSRLMARALLRQKGSGNALTRMIRAQTKAGSLTGKALQAKVQGPALVLAKVLQKEYAELESEGNPE